MSDKIHDQQQVPGSDGGSSDPPSLPSEDAMWRMAEACGCSPATRDAVAGCCGKREARTRTVSGERRGATAQDEVAG